MRRGRPPDGLGDRQTLRSYGSWNQMIQRCQNPNNPRYKDYGGRGILVCERWQKFANFLADMGERPPTLQLERLDNNGNYERSNCVWADRKAQMSNRRNTRTTPRNRMTRKEAAALGVLAAAAMRREETRRKLTPEVKAHWRDKGRKRLTVAEIEELSGLSGKTLYSELGSRPQRRSA